MLEEREYENRIKGQAQAEDIQEKLEAVCGSILVNARNELYLGMRFLAVGLCICDGYGYP